MTKKKLAHCKSLLDQGSRVLALVELFCLAKDTWSHDEQEASRNGDRISSLLDVAFKVCGNDYENTRKELIRLIQSTESPDTLDSCVNILSRFEDYATLESCRDLNVKVDPSLFFIKFSEYIGEYLCSPAIKEDFVYLHKGSIKSVKVDAYLVLGAFLAFNRDQGDVTTPLYRAQKRFRPESPVFAAAYDPVARRYVVTLKHEDRVLGVNSATLKIEKVVESPAAGVRGLAIQPALRRGFFNAEFGNVMFSFDLDSFEIREQIEGFSIRPERIHLDPVSNTVVTGNLGLDLIFPNSDYQKLRNLVCTRDKVTNGKSITVVDAETEAVTETLPAGRRPTAVGISKNYIAAGNFYDNSVTIYKRNDLSKYSTVKLNVIQDFMVQFSLHDKYVGKQIDIRKNLRARVVEGLAILEKRGWMLVSGFDACIITVVDIGKLLVTDIIPVQNRPFDVVVDDDEKFAYVSCHDSHQVSVIDLDLKQEVYRLETGPSPVDLTLYRDILMVADSTGVGIYDVKEIARTNRPNEDANGPSRV